MRTLLVLGPVLAALALPALGGGFTNRTAAPPKAPVAARPAKPNHPDHLLVKEARADTEAVLNDLLAGKYDHDTNFAPVARRVKGYTSWSIDSQEVDPDSPQAVTIDGTLSGPSGEATFSASMRKQQNGKWMIGWFTGPMPK
jgi:hypothetical protein